MWHAWRRSLSIQNLSENLNGRDSLADGGVNGRKILKLM
jgi:hypothetical protein